MITRKRLHTAFLLFCSMSFFEACICFIFLRKKLSKRQVCITTNIVNSAGVYSILMLNCFLVALAIIVDYIWTLSQLHKAERNIRAATDSKLNKPILISLGIYISLYVPCMICSCTLYFYEVPHMLIVFDTCLALFYMSTVLIPFLYCATSKDFRQGYKDIILCKITKENQQNRQIELAVIEWLIFINLNIVINIT